MAGRGRISQLQACGLGDAGFTCFLSYSQKVQKLTCVISQIGRLVNFALSLTQATTPNSMPSTWTGGPQGEVPGQGGVQRPVLALALGRVL